MPRKRRKKKAAKKRSTKRRKNPKRKKAKKRKPAKRNPSGISRLAQSERPSSLLKKLGVEMGRQHRRADSAHEKSIMKRIRGIVDWSSVQVRKLEEKL